MREGLVRRPEGIEIPYVVEGDASGPPIVWGHGLMGVGEHERETLAPLVGAGWTVATFDQRGHGGATPVTDPALYDPDAMGADMWAVADALGWERCWMGGSSMGAATSAVAALASPGRVEGLVQAIPALGDCRAGLAPLFAGLGDLVRDLGTDGFVAWMQGFMRSLGAAQPALDRLEDLRKHDPASLECALRTVPLWVLPGVPGRLATLEAPVEVVGWRGDPVHPFEVAEATAAVSPRARLVVVDMVQALGDPAAVGRALLAALEPGT